MVQHTRDRKARHFQFGQIGADCAADVVLRPVSDAAKFIEVFFQFRLAVHWLIQGDVFGRSAPTMLDLIGGI